MPKSEVTPNSPSVNKSMSAKPSSVELHIPIKILSSETATGSNSPSGNIHFREQKGDFQRLRTMMNSLLIVLFFALPFISIDGRQAILLDISQQQFFFFGITLWPQDFTLLAWIFIAAAFGLFFITVFWGRVWCGYLCPQTAWTFIYVWIETRIEGSSNKRKQLDKASWSGSKIGKRSTKHLLWGLAALLTGCGFISYFIPARELYMDILTGNASFWVTSWVWFFAICTYLNAGWMREQMCLHCCPYSRFQAVMFDANTKTVTYDAQRGESRGPRKRKQETNLRESNLGDCVDCNLCVEVCPTGIDIRNGLQYECINCGACVDACNETMLKFDYKPNLIGYMSENDLKGVSYSYWRSPRFLGYGAAVVIMLIVIGLDLNSRSEIQLNVIRDRQSLYRETADNKIENTYQLKIRNKTQDTKQYQLAVDSEMPFSLIADPIITLAAGEQVDYPVTVLADKDAIPSGRKMIQFSVTDVKQPSQQVSQETGFFSP
ncbi:cytochrome c oxidase accessory protein CcoG [Shewanella sp. 1180_01]|uniref:cytochrome c oxidase accessory protein CcoG n=1 Tax=Shewanella sp. 1180_01 TaxID=2604451 RepID=UPI00406303BA